MSAAELARLAGDRLRCRDDRVCLNGDFNFSARFEFDFLAIAIYQAIGHTDFAVEMVGTFDRDLRLLGFATVRMGLDYSFHFPWKCCTCLLFISRHRPSPSLDAI